jgi:LCP family protein required for cell wall assembly
MAPGHDDDLDWLYHRDKKPAAEPEPEPTRMFAPEDVPPAEQAGAQAPQQPQPQQRPPRPAQPQSGQQPPRQPPPQPPKTARGRRPKPPRPPKSRGRKVLRVIGIVLAAWLAYLIVVPIIAWGQVERVDYVPEGDRPERQPGTTYLLLGSDSRSGLSKEEQKEYGTGSTAGQRTDTIMILYVPRRGEPALISIPRDSYLEIPGNGSNKINAAYSIGGPQLMTATVEQNTGLRIDKYVEVGFGGFVNVINAIGGVEMCLKDPIKDSDAHIDLEAGCQNLEGNDALGYVRARKSDARGDLGRVERQRQMLAAIAKKAASPATVLNPVRYWRLANSGADSLAVGKGTSMFSVARMLMAMGEASGKGGLSLTVPISNPNATTSAGSSVLWDEEQAQAMFAEIASGDTSGLEKYAD